MNSLESSEAFMWVSVYVLIGSGCWLLSAACWFTVYALSYGAAELRRFAKEIHHDCAG